MKLLENKKGLYEYILTKSVMLIFILGLVGIFWSFYNTLNVRSANEIAESEATSIAREINDAIGFKGISNTVTIHLKPWLEVGRDKVYYTFEITDTGVVLVRFDEYPYQDILGIASFGMNLSRTSGVDKIDCTQTQLLNGVSLVVDKKSEWEYIPTVDKLYYVVTVTIDASECLDYMSFEGRFREG